MSAKIVKLVKKMWFDQISLSWSIIFESFALYKNLEHRLSRISITSVPTNPKLLALNRKKIDFWH